MRRTPFFIQRFREKEEETMRTFNYENVKNPEYFCDGRAEAHSDHAYYASEADRETGCSLFQESLNGIWKFHYAKNYDAVVPGFEKDEYCCASWDDIRRSEEHTSELQSRFDLVCRLLLEKKKKINKTAQVN